MIEPITCVYTGRALTQVETFVNIIDGEYTREGQEPSDDWRPIGREVAGVLRDRGFLIAGLVTPQ